MALMGFFFFFVCFDLGKVLSAEGVDEIWDKILFFGATFEDFLFVFNDDFVVCDFDNFSIRDGELGVDEGFKRWALNDDLFDSKIIGVDSKG